MAEAKIRTAGFDGFLATFGDTLSESANRAALGFRAAVEEARWDGVLETSTSLVSAFLKFDPLELSHEMLRGRLEDLLATRDWHASELPDNRRLWRIPTVFGTDLAPQLGEAAEAAGLSEAEAIKSLSETRVRAYTIGFAPGMPYLGELPEAWDIPRQTQLSDNVPAGALCVAIRQLVLFPAVTPTGWRHVGQTRFRLFRPEADEPFVLRPGDEVEFLPVTVDALEAKADDPDGGATSEALG